MVDKYGTPMGTAYLGFVLKRFQVTADRHWRDTEQFRKGLHGYRSCFVELIQYGTLPFVHGPSNVCWRHLLDSSVSRQENKTNVRFSGFPSEFRTIAKNKTDRKRIVSVKPQEKSRDFSITGTKRTFLHTAFERTQVKRVQLL
jgi:hypothetical protein